MYEMKIFHPLTEGEKFDVPRYITHLRMAKAVCGDTIKGITVSKNIPGTGYSATGDSTWPQHVAIGTILFENYDELMEKMKRVLPIGRQDIQFVTNIRAYTNFYEIETVPDDPLTAEEKARMESYL